MESAGNYADRVRRFGWVFRSTIRDAHMAPQDKKMEVQDTCSPLSDSMGGNYPVWISQHIVLKAVRLVNV